MANIKRFINTNLTVLYQGLDMRFLDAAAFQRLPGLEDDAYGSTFFNGPNGLQLMLPQRKVVIVIQGNGRVQVSDDYVKEPGESELISKYFLNVYEQLKGFSNVVYGFNYIFQVDSLKLSTLLNEKLYTLVDSTDVNQAVKLRYTMDGIKYEIRIEQETGNFYKILVNIERATNIAKLPSAISTLDSEFKEGYKIAKGIVDEL